jgi:pyruvate formate-lyase activating enzyme-like uncharacterized protein
LVDKQRGHAADADLARDVDDLVEVELHHPQGVSIRSGEPLQRLSAGLAGAVG